MVTNTPPRLRSQDGRSRRAADSTRCVSSQLSYQCENAAIGVKEAMGVNLNLRVS